MCEPKNKCICIHMRTLYTSEIQFNPISMCVTNSDVWLQKPEPAQSRIVSYLCIFTCSDRHSTEQIWGVYAYAWMYTYNIHTYCICIGLYMQVCVLTSTPSRIPSQRHSTWATGLFLQKFVFDIVEVPMPLGTRGTRDTRDTRDKWLSHGCNAMLVFELSM